MPPRKPHRPYRLNDDCGATQLSSGRVEAWCDSLGPQPLEAGSTPRNRVGGSDCTSVAALLSAYQGVHPELQVSEENVDMVAKSLDAGIGPHGGGGHD